MESKVIQEIVTQIIQQYRLPLDSLHGPAHWARVYENGRCLAERTGAREDVVTLFALFHDACRRADGMDFGHGRRGARLADSFCGLYFDLDPAGLDTLMEACANHTAGWIRADITVQTCWDADRLDLGRAGILPRPGLLCTQAARDHT
jgi:uncharacterized protein